MSVGPNYPLSDISLYASFKFSMIEVKTENHVIKLKLITMEADGEARYYQAKSRLTFGSINFCASKQKGDNSGMQPSFLIEIEGRL